MAYDSTGADALPRVQLDYTKTGIWLVATTDMERRYRAHSCRKEPWTVEWLEQYVEPGDVVYDVGANVGTFSLIAARGCGATVIAFEPGYANFARLCENIRLNDCDISIVPLPWALGDESGLTTFVYRSLEAGQSRHSLEAHRWRPTGRKDERYRQPICTIRLDDALPLFQLPPPAHIKVDVDGAEARVLRGAVTSLKSARSVLVEAEVALWDTVHALLSDAGFALASRPDRTKPGAPSYAVFER